MEVIVRDLLDIQINGSGAGGLGIGGHAEFFAGGILELGENEGGGRDNEKHGQMTQENGNPHGSSFAS
jgi:hypothetical protein